MAIQRLNIPDKWKHYFSEYPNGYTLLEAIIEWTDKVNIMIDDLNLTNKQIEKLFTDTLPENVENVLNEWYESGQLADLINIDLLDKKADKTEVQSFKNDFTKYKEIQKDLGVNVQDFGAVGDGVTDDTIALKNAITYARENGKTLILSGKHYVKETLDISNLKEIKGNGRVGSGRIRYDKRTYNGVEVGRSWFTDNHPPYSFLVEMFSENDDIITSDVANPIMSCNEGKPLLEGFSILGWNNFLNQVGFLDRTDGSEDYNDTIGNFRNVSVLYCGSHGIHLKRGIQYLNWHNVEVSCNGGHGLFVENVYRSNPLEYSVFNQLYADSNFLEGVYLLGYRMNVEFNNCNLSRNGQYHLQSQTNKNRSYPSDYKLVKKGIRVKTNGGIPGRSILFQNCYGEQCMGLFQIDSYTDIGVINSITAINNGFFPLTETEEEKAYTKAVLTITGQYVSGVNVINSYGTFGAYNIYNTINALYEVSVSGNMTNHFGLTEKAFKNYETVNITDSLDLKEGSVLKDKSSLIHITKTPSSDARNTTFDVSKYFIGSGGDKGVFPLVLMLSTNWQAYNNAKHGSYLVTVSKGFNGEYKMAFLPFNKVEGFTAEPTISSNGVVTIPLAPYYQCAVIRLGTNSFSDLSL